MLQSEWDFKEMMSKAEHFADKYKAEFWPTSAKIGQLKIQCNCCDLCVCICVC